MKQNFFRNCNSVKRKTNRVVSFNNTYRYMDDVLSINNNNFRNSFHLMYADEYEIKDTKEPDNYFTYEYFI
jgi:hypothetical protein